MNGRVLGAIAACLSLSFAATPAASAYAGAGAAPTLRHVEDVLFGALAESTYEAGRVTRWNRAPVVGLYGGDAGDRAVLERTVESLRPVLGPLPVHIRDTGTAGVTVAIIFAPQAEIPDLARANGMRADLAALGAGYTETVVRRDHALALSVTLIRDELTGGERAATLVHEFYHALGPGGHSPAFADSVVYGGADEPSTATRLAPVDVKTLGLLYRHLAPGDDIDAVRQAFARHWAGLETLVDQYNASISWP